jgi:NAD(P)-dependent dehydrogenase (short-subunit alcohol dehydrogenase family)
VDVVASNAALVEQVPLSKIAPDHYDRTFALNAKAPLFLVRKMLPMMGRGVGKIAEGGRLIQARAALVFQNLIKYPL